MNAFKNDNYRKITFFRVRKKVNFSDESKIDIASLRHILRQNYF
jgi:hypothetical protein